uniref:Uncharacterized protein n=1 Tax=Panagrolaimus davidi TaxID=227884 RepID=A0A914PB38_9BILA
MGFDAAPNDIKLSEKPVSHLIDMTVIEEISNKEIDESSDSENSVSSTEPSSLVEQDSFPKKPMSKREWEQFGMQKCIKKNK